MKINGIGASQVSKLYKDNKISKAESKKEVTKKDSLEISSLGKQLSGISSEDGLVNHDKKVEAIASQVANGTYKPDMRLTAQKILDSIKKRGI